MIPLGNIAGFKTQARWTVLVGGLIYFACYQWALPDITINTKLLVLAIMTVALYISILFHELGHAIVARSLGLEVDEIVLLMIGGVTILDQPENGADELKVAAAGPVVTVLIGAVLGGLYFGLRGSLVGTMVGVFALTNLTIGTLNALPLLPLDGGRALRGLLWKRSNHRFHATQKAFRLTLALLLLSTIVNLYLFMTDVLFLPPFLELFLFHGATRMYHAERREYLGISQG